MNPNRANAIATGTIAIATVIGLMSGLYYNLSLAGTSSIYIVLSELTLAVILFFTTIWLKENITQ